MASSDTSETSTIIGPPGATLIFQGAEARVYTGTFLGSEVIIKERFVKQYRHATLDQKLSVRRLQQEVRALAKCRKAGIDAPIPLYLDLPNRRIYMAFVPSITARELINRDAFPWNDQTKELASGIGRLVAQIHDTGLVHGDLTTSNILVRTDRPEQGSPHLVPIDFGLSSTSSLDEDRAVDLYVLERAFLSTHHTSESLFEFVLSAYGAASKKAKLTLNRLEAVRARGRKKLAFG